MYCDTLKLILDYFPSCRLIKLRIVSKLFKSAIDDMNIDNKGKITDECCKRVKKHKIDLFEYAHEYGCPHMGSIIKYENNKYDVAKLMEQACQYDTTTSFLLCDKLEQYCKWYNVKIDEDTKMKIIKVNSPNDYVKTRLMLFTANPFANNKKTDRMIISLLMSGNYFEYAIFNYGLYNTGSKFSLMYLICKFLSYCPKIMQVNIGFLLGLFMLARIEQRPVNDKTALIIYWLIGFIALLISQPFIGLCMCLIMWMMLYPIAISASLRICPYKHK